MLQIPVATTTSEASADTEEGRSVRAPVVAEPSGDLLDRALVGWERFLGTFEGASDE